MTPVHFPSVRLREIVRGVGDLVLEATCAGCGSRPSPVWCAACAEQLEIPAHRAMPDPVPTGMPSTWAVCDYAGPVRRAIVASKEDGRRSLGDALGAALATAVAASLASAPPRRRSRTVWLVPVPSSAASLRRRGEDPLLRVARRATVVLRRSGLRVELVQALQVRGSPRDQAGLTTAERADNLAGRHVVDPRWSRRLQGTDGVNSEGGACIVLLDDIVTTGATLTEAARALRAGGARHVEAAVVAATARRSTTTARSTEVGEVVPAGLARA